MVVNLTHQTHATDLVAVCELLINRATAVLASLKLAGEAEAIDAAIELSEILKLMCAVVGVRKGKRLDGECSDHQAR